MKNYFITIDTKEQRNKLEFGLKYYGVEIDIPNNCTSIIYNLNESNLDEDTFIKIMKYSNVKYNEMDIDKFYDATGKWKVQKYEGTTQASKTSWHRDRFFKMIEEERGRRK